MKIYLKDLDPVEIKTKGIELTVKKPSNSFLGKLLVTKSSITWCKGKKTKAKGKEYKWEDFINLMEKGKRPK